jgi:hypothetical protein
MYFTMLEIEGKRKQRGIPNINTNFFPFHWWFSPSDLPSGSSVGSGRVVMDFGLCCRITGIVRLDVACVSLLACDCDFVDGSIVGTNRTCRTSVILFSFGI